MPQNHKRTKLLDDPWLTPYVEIIKRRSAAADACYKRLSQGPGNLAEFACAHEFYGLHRRDDGWVFREWAPNATAIYLVGDFSDWKLLENFKLQRLERRDVWELHLPPDAISHGQYYRLEIIWQGGRGDRPQGYSRSADIIIFRAGLGSA
jgi:1,4-alpha-glucan branching enzyme